MQYATIKLNQLQPLAFVTVYKMPLFAKNSLTFCGMKEANRLQ